MTSKQSAPYYISIVAHARSKLTAQHIKVLKGGLIIAADGGANALSKVRLVPDFIIGDLDGIAKTVLRKFSRSSKVIRFPKDKDFTDLELAFQKAQAMKPKNIFVFCWSDERFDFTFSTLDAVRSSRIPVTLFLENSQLEILNRYRRELSIHHPSKVSVHALRSQTLVVSAGLKWPIQAKSSSSFTLSQSNLTLRPSSLRLIKGEATCLISDASRVGELKRLTT